MSNSYEVIREVHVEADPARVHGLVNDFHEWPAWSPWEGLDPDLQRAYSGADAGVGAHYAWSGNRKAGEGTMEITGSTPERVDVALRFLKPFPNSTEVSFALAPVSGGTDVTWSMRGEHAGLMRVIGKVVSMDRLVGKDFDKGLAQLKNVAERP